MIRQEARLAPITFLYPTERRFLSSTVRSQLSLATFFMLSTISVPSIFRFKLNFRETGKRA
jgi:hypothetical protein